ncbi:MAG: asparagine synthase (glutamine-hydrolyzing) [Salibacteraceae bacterium]
MCGITGIWNWNGHRVQQGTIERFNNSLEHRGPDGFGTQFHAAETLVFGHRRLSILDLSEAGKQPMRYADGALTLTFNGEIFNFIELRDELKSLGYSFKSDTDSEVVLAAYHQWGKECLNRFNGMWAIAIWDDREQELFLARDRFGIKPLYYRSSPNQFAFASETYAFKFLDGFDRSINEAHYTMACNDPMALEGSGLTVFNGINQLLPGHSMTIKHGCELIQNRWWNIDDHNHQEVPFSLDDQASKLKELLDDSCKLRLQSDVKVGTALSGGLDSSAIFSIVNDLLKTGNTRRFGQEAQEAFTISFPGLINDETEYAKTAFSYGTGARHHLLEADTTTLIDQIQEDSRIADYVGNWPLTSASLVYKAMKKSGVSVSLDGHGVDEMLYGYKNMVSSLFYNALYDHNKSVGAYSAILKTMDEGGLNAAKLDRLERDKEQREASKVYQLKQRLKNLFPSNSEESVSAVLPNSSPYDFRNKSFEDRQIYNEFFKTRLPTLLRNFDRASMINSVEVRMPFMDWRVVTYLFSLPMESKLGSGYTKLVLREAMKGAMNEEIRLRTTKIGIVSPIEHWFNQGFGDWLVESVSDAKIQAELKSALVQKVPFSSELVRAAWLDVNRSIIEGTQ